VVHCTMRALVQIVLDNFCNIVDYKAQRNATEAAAKSYIQFLGLYNRESTSGHNVVLFWTHLGDHNKSLWPRWRWNDMSRRWPVQSLPAIRRYRRPRQM